METSGKPSTAQIVLLATSSALTAVLYSIYKRKSSHVARLREAKKMPLNPDLKTILDEAPGKCVPYAVIEGVVRSVKETLNSQFVDNCKGVIERLTLKEKKMVWNRTTHLWNDCEKVIHQRTNTVPFDLAPHDGTVLTTVRVVRPIDAAELDLETTYENFHPSQQSLTNVISTICMCLKNFSHYGLTACATLFYLLWRQYVLRKERRKERSLLDEYRKWQSRRLQELHLAGDDLSPTTCTICLSRERSCVFLECGHTVKETLNSLSVDNCKRVLKEKRVLNCTTDNCLTGVGKMVQDSNLVCVPPPDIRYFLTLYSILKKQESGMWFLQALEGDVRSDRLRHLPLRAAQETEEKS
ncbi:mitochondrial ubiquitin ligase activator of NFKB 1-like [Sinocyclocheilus anshuiensis]|uniref:mitochondrial ubiquitin ligase activator of NFKB 1-like n=1 Tax=Sinocyclocheilus anshuiensis TaxID=1608454 RepID=UPI0007BA5DEA|nr:PREDICTED: mitochondrial ubiquitin ligase activator of NFKB 1-like [Sinocyclocheilus anshuiensis]